MESLTTVYTQLSRMCGNSSHEPNRLAYIKMLTRLQPMANPEQHQGRTKASFEEQFAKLIADMARLREVVKLSHRSESGLFKSRTTNKDRLDDFMTKMISEYISTHSHEKVANFQQHLAGRMAFLSRTFEEHDITVPTGNYCSAETQEGALAAAKQQYEDLKQTSYRGPFNINRTERDGLIHRQHLEGDLQVKLLEAHDAAADYLKGKLSQCLTGDNRQDISDCQGFEMK